MTDLERRALLGDREAREECTEKEIVLPCPFCGSQGKIIDFGEAYLAVCGICGASIRISSEKERAVESWNTRAVPSYGRCETCRHWNIEDAGVCSMHGTCGWTSRDFCSKYEKEAYDGQK